MRYLVAGAIMLVGCTVHGDAPAANPTPAPPKDAATVEAPSAGPRDAAVAEPGPVRPKAVTQAWLRETLHKKGSLAQLIDDGSGVVVIEYETDSPREDFKSITSGTRLCKDDLKKRWPKLEEDTRQVLDGSDMLACQNRPGPAMCAFGVANEYTTYTYVLFRPAAEGTLRLDAILHVDGLSNVTDKSSLIEQENFVRQQLTKLRSTDCQGKAGTPSEQYKQFHAMFH